LNCPKTPQQGTRLLLCWCFVLPPDGYVRQHGCDACTQLCLVTPHPPLVYRVCGYCSGESSMPYAPLPNADLAAIPTCTTTARAMYTHWPWCDKSARHILSPIRRLTWAVYGGCRAQTGEGLDCTNSQGSQAKGLDFRSLPQACGYCGFGPPIHTRCYASALRAARRRGNERRSGSLIRVFTIDHDKEPRQCSA
jgi:hypothetical protein